MTSQSFCRGATSTQNSFEYSQVSGTSFATETKPRIEAGKIANESGRSSVFTLGGRAPSPSCMESNYIEPTAKEQVTF